MAIFGLHLYSTGQHSRQTWILSKICGFLDSEVRGPPDKTKNTHELFHKLKQEWNNRDQKFIQKLIHSMSNDARLLLRRSATGRNTKDKYKHVYNP